jgi:hypothetical protein
MEPGQNPPQKKVKLAELGQPAEILHRRPVATEIAACDAINLLARKYREEKGCQVTDLSDEILGILSETSVYRAVVIHQNPPVLDATFTFVGKYLARAIREWLEDYERVAMFEKLSDDDAMRFVKEAIESGKGVDTHIGQVIAKEYHTGYALAIYANTNLYRCAMSCREFVADSSWRGFRPSGAEIKEAVVGVMAELCHDPMSYQVRVVRGLVRRNNTVRTFGSMDEVREAVCAQVK